MKTRVLFGVGGFAFVLLALYVFPPVVLQMALVALSVLATFELVVPTRLVRSRRLIGLSLVVALVQAGVTGGLGSATASPPKWEHLFATMVVAVLLSLVILLREHDRISFGDVCAALFAALILPVMLMSLWRVFCMPDGQFLVLLPLIAAWGSDSCALFAGMAFGRHKLAPTISPKKTVEGAVGGVLGSALLMLLVVYLFRRFAGVEIAYGGAVLLGAVGAAIGQIGDLSFSIIKRQTGIKDYGHIFPGHGGVLDRFDSVIFVAPVAELILRAFAR